MIEDIEKPPIEEEIEITIDAYITIINWKFQKYIDNNSEEIEFEDL